MPSPIGHTLTGFFGFLLVRYRPDFSKYFSRSQLLITALVFTNLPDVDFIPGLLFLGDMGAWHRQATHSFFVAILISIIGGGYLKKGKKSQFYLMIWLFGLYGSHILLDMLVNDLYPPRGVQCFFPFDLSYYIFPITILGGLQYKSGILNLSNLWTILQEIIVIPALVLTILYLVNLGKNKLRSRDSSCEND